MKKLVLFTIIITTLLCTCTKKYAFSCEDVTLYYTPNCATVDGYVVFGDSATIRVFRQDIDPQFQHLGVKVCISYEEMGEQLLTAECMTAPMIKITSIKAK